MTLEREHVTATGAPPAVAYSHAVRIGSLLFVSGQLPLDHDRRLVAPGDLAGQTRRVLENLTRVLKAGGATWADVAKLTMFVVDIRAIAQVRDVRAAFFAEQGIKPPAVTAVGVAELAVDGALIEIEAYAVVDAAPA